MHMMVAKIMNIRSLRQVSNYFFVFRIFLCKSNLIFSRKSDLTIRDPSFSQATHAVQKHVQNYWILSIHQHGSLNTKFANKSQWSFFSHTHLQYWFSIDMCAHANLMVNFIFAYYEWWIRIKIRKVDPSELCYFFLIFISLWNFRMIAYVSQGFLA